MEMKEPNEKECLVHSRDNRGRKMSPACPSGEPGTSKFREIAARAKERRGTRGDGARIRHFCSHGKVGLIKCLTLRELLRADALVTLTTSARWIFPPSTFFENAALFQKDVQTALRGIVYFDPARDYLALFNSKSRLNGRRRRNE